MYKKSALIKSTQLNEYGEADAIWTHTSYAHYPLKVACLPIPPRPHSVINTTLFYKSWQHIQDLLYDKTYRQAAHIRNDIHIFQIFLNL